MTDSKWDETLTVGELVTAYDSGYHVITRFEFRDGTTPLVYTIKVVDGYGILLKNRREYSCDAAFVQRHTKTRIDDDWSAALEQVHRKRDNLLKFATQ